MRATARPLLCLLLLLGAGLWAAALPRPAAEARPPRAEGPRYDRPDLAQEHYRAKRVGRSRIDVQRLYEAARLEMAEMPRYSTARGGFLPMVDAGAGLRTAGSALDRWEPLGPGNIGGRTRAFVVHPNKTRILWAGGVSGGIWKSTNRGRSWRPVGDELVNLAINALVLDPNDPDVLYAGTGEGYFREEVRGTALPLRGAGIFQSTDGGESWERLKGTRRPRFHFVNDLLVSRHDPERIYAATRSGIFRTDNGGRRWKRVLNPRVRGGCLDLVERTDAKRNDYLLASCGTLVPGAVWRNTAAQKDRAWEQVLAEPEMARSSLAIAPSDQRIVYALAASQVPGPNGRFEQALHAVFRSDSGGAPGSWRAVLRNTDPDKLSTLILHNPISASLADCGFGPANDFFAMGWYVNTIAVDPRDPDIVWAGGVDIFRSEDGGASWRPASYWWADADNPNFAHADQHALVFEPRDPNTLYLLGDGGVFRTSDARAPLSGRADAVCAAGANPLRWESLNRSYGVTQFYHGSVTPDGGLYIAGAQDNGTLLGRPALGENGWFEIFGGDGGYNAIDPTDPRRLYVSVQGGRLRRSTDGGATFLDATSGLFDLDEADDFTAQPDNYLFITPFVMDPNEPRRLWIGGKRVFRTDNGAAFWNPASELLEGGGRVSALAVAPGDPDRVVVATTEGDVYRTDIGRNAGEETVWERSRPRAGWVTWLAFDPSDPDVVYATYALFGGKHVWRSDNGGVDWRPIDGSGPGRLPNIPVHAILVDPRDSERLYLGTDLGVFASLDGGATWAVENTGFAAAVTESLALAPNPGGTPWLFAFTHGRGAWRVRLD